MAFRSSAVDIYDQKEKADWRTLCITPDAAVQKEETQNSEVVLDVELGPVDSKARGIKAAAVQLPPVSEPRYDCLTSCYISCSHNRSTGTKADPGRLHQLACSC